MSGRSTKLLKTDTHKQHRLLKTDTSKGSTGCYRTDKFRGSIQDMSRQHRLLRITCNMQTRLGIGQDAEVGKLLKIWQQLSDSTLCLRLVSECFGYISFGLTETSKLAVTIYVEAKQRFVSAIAETSLGPSFGCFETKLVSKDTLQAYIVLYF
jgi:hypothetical protein